MLTSFRDFRLVAMLCVALAAACTSHAVLIDDFSDGAASLRREVGDPQITDIQTGLSTDSVIGGEREVTLGAIGSPGAVTVDIDTDAEQMIYDTDPGVLGVNFFAKYGSIDDPLHVDFTAGGADRIRFEFESASFSVPALLDVLLTTQSDVTSTGRTGGSQSIVLTSSDHPFVLDVFLDQFSQVERMNLADVWSISFGTGNGNLPGSFVLNSVRTIPEPSSVALFGMGLLALRLVLPVKR